MFGRQAESARIEQLLDGVTTGPVGLALEGAPGIGKTTLWRQAVRCARTRGYTVIATAPAEPDAALAFAGLADLCEALPEHALATLSGPQRHPVGAVLVGGSAEQDPHLGALDPHVLPRAILGIVRALAADAPTIVAIDDEQWLDRPSARALAFALCRLRGERIGVLLTRRPNSDGALWPQLERGFAEQCLPSMTIGPLDPGTIQELLVTELGRKISTPLIRRIAEVSGGNPLYGLAIARELSSSSGVADQRIPIPRTLAGAIIRRLERLDPRARDPLLAAAALSSPTLALIQAVLPAFTLSDLDSAAREDVIAISGDRVSFAHPVLASTHYEMAPSAHRRELHRRLAEVVINAEERAQHLALGAEAPDRATALAIEDAARGAAQRGTPDLAAELLEHAVDHRRSPSHRCKSGNPQSCDGDGHAMMPFDAGRHDPGAA